MIELSVPRYDSKQNVPDNRYNFVTDLYMHQNDHIHRSGVIHPCMVLFTQLLISFITFTAVLSVYGIYIFKAQEDVLHQSCSNTSFDCTVS